MRTIARSTLIAALIAVFGAACGGSDAATGPGTPTISAAVDSVDVERGHGQQGPPLTVLPDSIVGQVLDDAGDPVDGVTIDFQAEAGSFESGTLVTNSSGRVFNALETPETAWTARVMDGRDSAYDARLVASRDGRPDVVSEFTFAVDPGAPRVGSSPGKLVEDGTFDEFGDDGDALAQLTTLWSDDHDNPLPYDVAVLDGPSVTVESGPGAGWMRSIRAGSETGTGTLRVWTLPDSANAVDGAYEIRTYEADGAEQTWVCVALGAWTLDDCDGPPSGS